jgi:poly-gamma-glutamate capsule biosynthesis protein CapA/YwtB (metallophosphatase superfamily)
MRRVGRTSVLVGTAFACLLIAGCQGSSGGSNPVHSSGPPSTPATTSGQGFSLVATGDVLLHPALWAQAKKDGRGTGMNFAPMLADVNPVISGADLAICHLETPLAGRNGPFSGYPLFSGPPQIVKALKTTGYDACSTASNHTFDQGAAGITRTLDALDRAGIAHAGSARTEAESRTITMVTANGVRVALLSYAFGWNGRSYPNGQHWRGNIIDPATMEADAKRARSRGAQAVILAVHWGTEYSQQPSAQQLALAPKLARSGDFDLIISHHAHVVEPIQKIGKTWVVYGLGNFVAYHATPGAANAEGLLVKFWFTRTKTGRFTVSDATYLPLLMARHAPIRVLDVPKALREKDYGSSSRARLVRALHRTTAVVDSRGAADAGLTPYERSTS